MYENKRDTICKKPHLIVLPYEHIIKKLDIFLYHGQFSTSVKIMILYKARVNGERNYDYD